jgi:hypothetical protein
MRLHNYILEFNENPKYDAPRSKSISKEEAISFLRDKASHALDAYLKNGAYMYRGVNNTNDFLFTDPSKYTRLSKNTVNVYTTLFSEILPSWKDYPKRSKSLICTTDPLTAGGYGNAFSVFPQNGADIGTCPTQDFWGAFRNSVGKFQSNYGGGMDLDDFAGGMVRVCNKLGIAPKFDDKASTLNTMSKIQESLKSHKSTAGDDGVFKLLLAAKGKDLIPYLNTLLDPNKNDIHLSKVGQPLPDKREVWTDAPCLLIAFYKTDELTKAAYADRLALSAVGLK